VLAIIILFKEKKIGGEEDSTDVASEAARREGLSLLRCTSFDGHGGRLEGFGEDRRRARGLRVRSRLMCLSGLRLLFGVVVVAIILVVAVVMILLACTASPMPNI